MSWFSKLFGGSNNTNTDVQDNIQEQFVPDDINVLEDLFINKEVPSSEPAQKSQGHSIRPFLDRDYFRKGYEDGYNWHSTDMLQDNIKGLKAEFRMQLGMKIDEYKSAASELEDHKINTEGMSDRLTKQIENRIARFNANITELEAEIAMSALDEGLAMTIIHKYRDGFLRGTQAYQEEKLIAGSTGMFD